MRWQSILCGVSFHLVLWIKTTLEFFSYFVEQRINANEQVSVENATQQSCRNAETVERQDVQERTNGSHCENNDHRFDLIVIALKVVTSLDKCIWVCVYIYLGSSWDAKPPNNSARKAKNSRDEENDDQD